MIGDFLKDAFIGQLRFQGFAATRLASQQELTVALGLSQGNTKHRKRVTYLAGCIAAMDVRVRQSKEPVTFSGTLSNVRSLVDFDLTCSEWETAFWPKEPAAQAALPAPAPAAHQAARAARPVLIDLPAPAPAAQAAPCTPPAPPSASDPGTTWQLALPVPAPAAQAACAAPPAVPAWMMMPPPPRPMVQPDDSPRRRWIPRQPQVPPLPPRADSNARPSCAPNRSDLRSPPPPNRIDLRSPPPPNRSHLRSPPPPAVPAWFQEEEDAEPEVTKPTMMISKARAQSGPWSVAKASDTSFAHGGRLPRAKAYVKPDVAKPSATSSAHGGRPSGTSSRRTPLSVERSRATVVKARPSVGANALVPWNERKHTTQCWNSLAWSSQTWDEGDWDDHSWW